MCSALGLNGLLGATNRRMLSLAEAPVTGPVPLACGMDVEAMGVPFVVGAGIVPARGIVTGVVVLMIRVSAFGDTCGASNFSA